MNLYKKVVLHHFNFKKPVYDIKYSPSGRYVMCDWCVCVCVCGAHPLLIVHHGTFLEGTLR